MIAVYFELVIFVCVKNVRFRRDADVLVARDALSNIVMGFISVICLGLRVRARMYAMIMSCNYHRHSLSLRCKCS